MHLTGAIHVLKIDFEIPINPQKTISRLVNVILVLGEKITLIDSGVKGSEKIIFDYLRVHQRRPEEIATLILSHAHPDHIGAAAAIKAKTGCRVLAHSEERDWIEHIEHQMQARPVPGFYTLVSQGVALDGVLSDRQKLQVDQHTTLAIMHTPGHSRGSIAILFEEDRVLFTGDAIPLQNDLPNYDHAQALLASLDKIRSNQAYDILLSSWTAPLRERAARVRLLDEGQAYLEKIDVAVKCHYQGEETKPLEFCSQTLAHLGLPAFLTGDLVDKALRSHLQV